MSVRERETYLRPRKAAEVIDVSVSSVRNMIRDGRLRSVRLKDTRAVRIPLSSLRALVDDPEDDDE